jgi:DNA-directed RNA polymerase subunit beta'
VNLVHSLHYVTFHVGGVAGSASVESSLTARFDGTIQFDGLRTVTTENVEKQKVQTVIGRTGEVRIMDLKMIVFLLPIIFLTVLL